MEIYLDTSHLQKWHKETLHANEIAILDQLKDSGNHTFILSITHIFDITDREDIHSAIKMGKFLDQLPIKWLRNAADLKREEIKNALKCFKHRKFFSISPFVEDYVDTLETEENSLPIRLAYRGKSIEQIITVLVSEKSQSRSLSTEHIYSWSHTNSTLINNMHNTPNKNKEMQKNLRRVLKDDITKLNLQSAVINSVISQNLIDPIDEFISWLIKNPH